MSTIKSKAEIERMRAAGHIVWEAHQVAAKLVKPGISTGEINEAVEQLIAERHAIPLFKGVPGPVPFPAAACISVNDEIVHGIPGKRQLKEGDIVSIDIGAKLDGWCGDAAMTHAVGKISQEKQQLLAITEGTLRLALELLATKSRWSEVAREMERYVKKANFAVFERIVGHGIGRELWEDPQVPNYTNRHFESFGDFALKPGLVIAVEPMVATGTNEMRTLADQWTIATQDGRPAAHFEHTIALTKDGPDVLTTGEGGFTWAL